MTDTVRELALLTVRLAAGLMLMFGPGLALCCWLYPSRGLDWLERAYLASLASLCLVTLVGVGLLEMEGHLAPRALAYWSVASSSICTALWAAGRILNGQHPAYRRSKAADASGASVRERARVRGVKERIRTSLRSVGSWRRTRRLAQEWATGRWRARSCWLAGRRARWILARGALLSVVALTLVVYSRCSRESASGGGPAVAFSIPIASLETVQAALRGKEKTAIPFRVDNLGLVDCGYRVEAWVAGEACATMHMVVAAGESYRGKVTLPAAADAVPVNLYLYEGSGFVPLAHLRLWATEEERAQWPVEDHE